MMGVETRKLRDDLGAVAIQPTMMRIWAKREEQLKGVLDSSAGLYGDLQGIAGRAMSEIEGLGPLMIESKSTPIVK